MSWPAQESLDPLVQLLNSDQAADVAAPSIAVGLRLRDLIASSVATMTSAYARYYEPQCFVNIVDPRALPLIDFPLLQRPCPVRAATRVRFMRWVAILQPNQRWSNIALQRMN